MGICSDVNDMRVAARAWLNSQIQAWGKNFSPATKRANVKDDDGNIVQQLTRSEMPLKGFSDTAFRERAQDTETSKRIEGTETNGKREMMQSIACLIYEMNKCAVALTQQNADEFLAHLSQTKSTFIDPPIQV